MATPYREQAEQEQSAARVDWAARLKAAEEKRERAKAALSPEDRAEIEAREKLAAIESETRAEEARQRALDLERRLDAARETLGDDALIEAVSIDGRADTFIIQHDPKAHAKWERDTAKAPHNSKLDPVEINRNYAADVVVDWNGETDFGAGSPHGAALNAHLKRNPGIATAIVNKATRLAGLFTEERKS